MSFWKKAGASVLLVAIATYGLGYLTALYTRDSCIADTYLHVQNREIIGRDMRGRRVAIPRREISAHVIGPFQVEVSYMVPRGLHGNIHRRRYVVLPWRHYLRSSEVFYLVGSPTAPLEDSAPITGDRFATRVESATRYKGAL